MIELSKGQAAAPIVTNSGEQVRLLTTKVKWKGSQTGKSSRFGFGGPKRANVDLDLSLIARDENGVAIGGVYFGNTDALKDSMLHKGDARNSKGKDWAEEASVDLTRVPQVVKRIDITLSSYKGHTFESIDEANIGLFSGESEDEFADLYLPIEGTHSACLVAVLTRNGTGWEVKVVGTYGNARTWQEMKDWAARV